MTKLDKLIGGWNCQPRLVCPYQFYDGPLHKPDLPPSHWASWLHLHTTANPRSQHAHYLTNRTSAEGSTMGEGGHTFLKESGKPTCLLMRIRGRLALINCLVTLEGTCHPPSIFYYCLFCTQGRWGTGTYPRYLKSMVGYTLDKFIAGQLGGEVWLYQYLSLGESTCSLLDVGQYSIVLALTENM